MGRKRLYKNDAEKLRCWRLKKRLEQDKKLYGEVKFIPMNPEDREIIEATTPELLKGDKSINPEDLETLEQFEDWLQENTKDIDNYSWECPVCHDYNSLLRSRCRHCSEPMPEEYQKEVDLLLEIYPIAKRFIGE